MARAQLSRHPLLLAILATGLLTLSACSSTPNDPTAGWSPNRLYADARDELDHGGYEKAIPLLDKLEGRAAGTPLAQQAQVDKAYAQYKNGEPVLAVATLDRFLKLHPASPAADYALYLKGIINFNGDLGLFSSLARQDPAERDQKAAKDSFEAFRELVQRFPQSKYAPDATARMAYIVNMLAESEVHVARYYYQRGAYLAAVNRAQAAVTDYPQAPARVQALALIVQAYDAMGLSALRDDAQRVLDTNRPAQAPTDASGSRPWWKFW